MRGIELDAPNRAVRFLRCSGWKECSSYEEGKDLTEHWFYCYNRDDRLEIKLIIPELEKLTKHYDTNYVFNVFEIHYNYAKTLDTFDEKYDSIEIIHPMPSFMRAQDNSKQVMFEDFMNSYFKKERPLFSDNTVKFTLDKKNSICIEEGYNDLWHYVYKYIDYQIEILNDLYEKCNKLREKLWKQWFIGVEEFKNVNLIAPVL